MAPTASSPPQRTSVINTAGLAEASVNADAQLDPVDGEQDAPADAEAEDTAELEHCLSASYHQPSHMAVGQSRATTVPALPPADKERLPPWERDAAREQERSLLRDNQVIPPKHPRKRRSTTESRRSQRGVAAAVAEGAGQASEETPLLDDAAGLPYGGQDSPENIDRKWEEAVLAGQIKTTWQREGKTLLRYSWPLTITFLLQYSLTMTSVFVVGHIGTNELGAVSLASMTAAITGYGVYQGMATSLDTLCAQAYGSGRKKLVGLQMQRMVLVLLVLTIPIGAIWLSGTRILRAIVAEQECAELAGQYLKIVLLGAPGFLCFEAGKRFVQAQGLFKANLYILLLVAPFNVFLHWLLVWRLGLGFIGAPIAVAVTESMLPLCLAAYVRFVAGGECWGGFSRAALRNWGPMIRLALPGLVMVMAEYLAFEILTLAAARLGPTELAAQSVLSNISIITWQVSFSISIAAGTRIANLIGATLADAARTSAKVAVCVEVGVGLANTVLLVALREVVPRAFTNVPAVAETVSRTLPIVAALQLFDAIAGIMNGILRGMGRQEVGGIFGLICYYAVGVPLSFVACFGFGWGLMGLWSGTGVALILLGAIEGYFISRTSWDRSVEDAKRRNSAS